MLNQGLSLGNISVIDSVFVRCNRNKRRVQKSEDQDKKVEGLVVRTMILLPETRKVKVRTRASNVSLAMLDPRSRNWEIKRDSSCLFPREVQGYITRR